MRSPVRTFTKPIDGATTNGVELELAGELAEGWNVSAGYTYARTRDKDDQRIYGFPLATSKPEHVVRTFTTYRLPGALDQVTVGGGVSWQSAFYGQSYSPNVGGGEGGSTMLKQGGYTLVDLMTRYQYDDHLSFTVNAYNVFDKTLPDRPGQLRHHLLRRTAQHADHGEVRLLSR